MEHDYCIILLLVFAPVMPHSMFWIPVQLSSSVIVYMSHARSGAALPLREVSKMLVNQAHDTVRHPFIDNSQFPFLHYTCFISTPSKLTRIARNPSKRGRLYSRTTSVWGDSDHVQRVSHDDAHFTNWEEISHDGYAKDSAEIEPRRYNARRDGYRGRRGYLREDQWQRSANGRARLRGGSDNTREWRQNRERHHNHDRHGWSEHGRLGGRGRTNRGEGGRLESQSVSWCRDLTVAQGGCGCTGATRPFVTNMSPYYPRLSSISDADLLHSCPFFCLRTPVMVPICRMEILTTKLKQERSVAYQRS